MGADLPIQQLLKLQRLVSEVMAITLFMGDS